MPKTPRSLPLTTLALVLAVACGSSSGGKDEGAQPPSGGPIDVDVPDQQAGQIPGVTAVGLVAPDVLAVDIADGRVIQSKQIPYAAEAGDSVQVEGTAPYQSHWLYRGGRRFGVLVGPAHDLLWPLDALKDSLASVSFLDSPGAIAVSSSDDSSYTGGRRPTAVYRKTRPVNIARTGPWDFGHPLVHTVYLRLPSALQEGRHYRVTFGRNGLDGYGFVFSSDTLVSEAVHVNGLGFHPADERKLAFVSCWMGKGGALTYAQPPAFRVVNRETGATVLQGQATLSLGQAAGEDGYARNYSKTDVYLLDFSSIATEGRYRIVLPGVGCSRPFDVKGDVWARAFRANVHGLLNQRSGIALGAPHTSFTKPRDFHPDDGLTVYASTCSLLDSGNGLNARGTETNNFDCLVRGKTNTLVPNVWGGYHDAGDWDRRIQHLDASRALIELTELFPQAFAATSLDLPESGNGLPDTLNEALWNMELYRRLQTAEGGIRGGVESAEHPLTGETSWQESLPVMTYAPDMWSSFLYAGDAARLALLLRGYDAGRAALHETSAIRAADYAEDAFASHNYTPLPYEVRDARNLAAAALYRLTGQARWHQIFKDTCKVTSASSRLLSWSSRQDATGWDQRDSAFVYLATTNRALDATLAATLRGAYRNEADRLISTQRRAGFRWIKGSEWEPFLGGRGGSSQTKVLLRAHWLFREPQYLNAALEASQFALGANPTNWGFTSGLGVNPVQHAFVIDSRLTGQPAPEGITVYGPADPLALSNDSVIGTLVTPYVVPSYAEWPANECYFDVYMAFMMNEFTIMETIAHNVYAWGYFQGVRPTP